MDAMYAAHVVTSDAVGLGGAEIIVMTSNDESSGGDPIASYALPDGDSPTGVLAANGWRSTGDGESEVEPGYTIVEVVAAERKERRRACPLCRAVKGMCRKLRITIFRHSLSTLVFDNSPAA